MALIGNIVSRYAAALNEEKVKALLVKLRKGSDSSITLKQLLEVLRYLGGWAVEPFVGLVQLHGYPQDPNAPNLETDSNPLTVKARWELTKDLEVRSLPSSPQAMKHYTMDVTAPTSKGFNFNLTGYYFREWVGANGLRFTSPEGAVFELLPSRSYYIQYSDPKKIPYYEIRTWLRDSTSFLAQVSNALGVGTYEREREESKPRTRENTGTCPCCFRSIKLKRQGDEYLIVLHGYERPGWGQVHGRCLGVGYQPFELSPKGTLHLVKVLHDSVRDSESSLRDLQNGKVTELYTTQGSKLTLDLLIKRYGQDVGNREWVAKIEGKVRDTIALISDLKKDIKLLDGLIDSWKKQELPQVGEAPKPPPMFLR